MATRKTTTEEAVDIELSQSRATYHLLGTTPLIQNRMSEKARHEILLPRGKLNAAQRATNLKHEPLVEFRAAAHTIRIQGGPTLLGVPSPAFKAAMGTAALDLPGTMKTKIARLTFVEGYMVNIYGIPELLMSVVRMADMNHTPDIRSRPIIARWACEVTVRYMEPQMNGQMVSRLLAAAGMSIGVGDWRNSKGSGNFGLWDIVRGDNPEWLELIKTGGRDAQEGARKSLKTKREIVHPQGRRNYGGRPGAWMQ